MADTKISALSAATTPLAGTEVLPIVQSGSTVKVSVADLTANRNVDTAALTVTSVADNVFTATPFNLSLKDTTAYAQYVGGGVLFSGKFNSGGAIAEFAAISGVKANSTDGNYDGLLNFMVRQNGTGGGNQVRMSIDASGIVTMPAYGAGAATFSAAGVISSVSDETWKTKDGVPVNPDVMLKKLKPGYWYYNDEKKAIFGADRQLGFYAQNVNAAIGPEAAPKPEEGKPWGYYDRSVLAVVVMSLQKALETIDSLTARIATLENKP